MTRLWTHHDCKSVFQFQPPVVAYAAQVLDMIDKLFRHIFEGLNKKFGECEPSHIRACILQLGSASCCRSPPVVLHARLRIDPNACRNKRICRASSLVCAARELKVIGGQYPFEPLQWLPETLKLEFAEGIQMLKDAGFEVFVETSC